MILVNDNFINLYEELNTLNEEVSPAFELDYEKELKDLQKQDPKALEELWPKIKSICINLSRNVFHNKNTWNYQFQLMYNAYQTEKRSKELLDDSKFIEKVNESFIKETLFNRLKETTLSKDQFDNILKSTDIKLLDGKYSFNDLNHKHSILSVESPDPTRHYRGEDVVDLKSDADEAVGKYVEVKATTTTKDNPQATHTSKVVFVYKLDADRLDVFVSWAAVKTVIDSLVTTNKREEATITEATDFSDKYLWVCAEENVRVKEHCISVRQHPAVAIVTAFGVSNSNDIKENYNMPNLLEIYDLLEWSDYGASRKFWSEAKAGRLDGISFWNAYYSDLSKLGLSDLFDTKYKELKEKSSYGKIKKAAEENPDSWAVKALLKMWVLQFKDGVKSNGRIRWEEDEQKLADRKTELAEVEAQIPEFMRVFEETGNRIFSEVAKQANDQIRVNNKYLEEIKKVSNGFADNISFTAPEIDETNTIKIDFYYSEPSISNFNANFVVTIEEIFGKNTNYNYRKLKDTLYGADRDSEVSLRPAYNADGMTVEKMKEKAEKLFNGIATILKTDLGNIDHSERIKATYDKTVKAVEDSKKAQDAVNTGKPVDPDFIAEVLAVFKNGLKKADAEYASWASWKYDDGDSGAAFEHEKYKTMNAAAVYLFNCNWRSYVNDREIATWRNTDSEKALEDALSKTFDAASQELSIEIIK